MLKATTPLSIPIYVTTQNRARLGPTIAEFAPYLNASNPNLRANQDKTMFSMIVPEIKALLASRTGETQPPRPLDVILLGIETHICVTQTTLDLLELGHRVYILADAVSSVNPEERSIALARLRDAGAIVTTSESVLFEVVGDAKREGFKEVSGLVKEMGAETKGALEVFCAASKI